MYITGIVSEWIQINKTKICSVNQIAAREDGMFAPLLVAGRAAKRRSKDKSGAAPGWAGG